MKIKRFNMREDSEDVLENIKEIFQIEILDNYDVIDYDISIYQPDWVFYNIEVDILSLQIKDNIEYISTSFNLLVKRIMSLTGLRTSKKNELSAFNDSNGLLGYFPVDWEYPFEQELLILMEDDPHIIKFVITLW